MAECPRGGIVPQQTFQGFEPQSHPVLLPADARLIIPMQAGLRSLNVAMAAAIVAGEAMRQLKIAGKQERRAS